MTDDELLDYLNSQPRRRNQHPEFDEQCAVFAWRQLQLNVYPELRYLYSTLNGVRLPIQAATRMKRSGMTKGVLDLCLPVRREPYSGLYIELKVGRNACTPEQLDWIGFLTRQGYYACARWGADATITTIMHYLEGSLK